MASSPPSIYGKRKRASTPALLGNRYSENPGQIPPIPIMSRNLNDYTDERVLSSLQYVDRRLNDKHRKVTPISERILREANETIHVILETTDPKQRTAAVSELQLIEGELFQHTVMRLTPSNNLEELQQSLVALRQLEFYAAYGDYLRAIVTLLRAKVRKNGINGFESFGSGIYITRISKKIRDETDAYIKLGLPGSSVTTKDCSTIIDVRTTASKLQLDEDHALDLVHMYADRNSQMHNGIMEKLESLKFDNLAKQLSRDRAELSAVMPYDLEPERLLIRNLIDVLLNRWWDRSFAPHEPEAWIQTRFLREDATLLMKKTPGAKAKIIDSAATALVTSLTTAAATAVPSRVARMPGNSAISNKRKASSGRKR